MNKGYAIEGYLLYNENLSATENDLIILSKKSENDDHTLESMSRQIVTR